jgi:hypothetical protein
MELKQHTILHAERPADNPGPWLSSAHYVGHSIIDIWSHRTIHSALFNSAIPTLYAINPMDIILLRTVHKGFLHLARNL